MITFIEKPDELREELRKSLQRNSELDAEVRRLSDLVDRLILDLSYANRKQHIQD